ncbi:MAG: phosphoglucosamine mutase [Pirellulales bacterium]
MSSLIISVSGLRGVVGESLTPDVAIRYAVSFASQIPAGSIVLTRDGRPTGRMLADLVRGALCAMGRDVIDVDVAATPTTGILVRRFQAAGGIQISASHNPSEYNGMKLFSPTGQVLSAAAGQPIVEQFHSPTTAWVSHQRVGVLRPCDDSLTDHLALVLAQVNVERIRDCAFPVLLDSNHGAGSLLGRKLLESLGCSVTLLGGQPDGRFSHKPEPTADNLADVAPLVPQNRAVVGFCQDPDADRLALIDEQGRYIGEEYTLALCLDHILRKRPGPVVTNCATSRMAADLAARYGVPYYKSAVGEANVVAEMQKHNAAFGGEGNGGPIDPNVGFVRDSFVGMALLLDALAERQIPLSRWVAEIPRYAIRKTTVTLERDQIPRALAALQTKFAEATPNTLDGLRLDWSDRWLLVRASNTEPIVRLIVEAPTPAAAEQLCEEAADVIACQ